MKIPRIHTIVLLGIIATVFTAAPDALSQPRLDLRYFKANTPQYYYYQLYFAAYCGDSVIYDLKKEQLILEERFGLISTDDYQIDRYATPTRNACYDLALAFDNSSRLTGADLALIADVGGFFVDSMSQSCQRAAIISYADRPTLRSFLSADRALMKAAMNEMTPGGDRALYDAINTGIIELITNGEQTLRIILALTAGSDNASATREEELIDDALYHGVRIFIVGLGGGFDSQPLERVARESGGMYFPVTTLDELAQLYADLPGFFQREFDEYRIVRRTKTVDMKNTLIRLRLEACSDSVWAERTFLPANATAVDEPANVQLFTLGQSWPNPVSMRNALLQIRFHLDGGSEQKLALRLYDGLGREVATIMQRRCAPGTHTVAWQPQALAPGVYYYRLTGGTQVSTGKMTVIP